MSDSVDIPRFIARKWKMFLLRALGCSLTILEVFVFKEVSLSFGLLYPAPPKKESSNNVRLRIKCDRLSGFAILIDILARKR